MWGVREQRRIPAAKQRGFSAHPRILTASVLPGLQPGLGSPSLGTAPSCPRMKRCRRGIRSAHVASALLSFGSGWFSGVCGCPGHCRMFSSNPCLYPLDASSTPSAEPTKNVSRLLPKVPWEAKSPGIENQGCNFILDTGTVFSSSFWHRNLSVFLDYKNLQAGTTLSSPPPSSTGPVTHTPLEGSLLPSKKAIKLVG